MLCPCHLGPATEGLPFVALFIAVVIAAFIIWLGSKRVSHTSGLEIIGKLAEALEVEPAELLRLRSKRIRS